MMQNLHILIIEDESILALDLSMQIKSQGYHVVDYVTSLELAQQVLQQYSDINLLLLDINLNENIDGIDFYKQIKQNTPVIYLTAYTDATTINKAINTYPLGYLTKPIDKPELFALLKLANLKYNASLQETQNIIKLANNYTFDTMHDILTHNNEYIKINGKKLQLLKILINAKGEYVPFYHLEDALYKEYPASESSLRTLIYRLRLKLTHDMIQTEHSYGVKLKRD